MREQTRVRVEIREERQGSELNLSCQMSLSLKWDAPGICVVTFSFCSGGRCCH